MAKNKIIISIIVAVVLITIATVGTILILNSVNNKKTTETSPTTLKNTAQDLRVEAEAARKENNTTKSKELLLEAQQTYNKLEKTDATSNAQEDIKAQLFLLDAAKK